MEPSTVDSAANVLFSDPMYTVASATAGDAMIRPPRCTAQTWCSELTVDVVSTVSRRLSPVRAASCRNIGQVVRTVTGVVTVPSTGSTTPSVLVPSAASHGSATAVTKPPAASVVTDPITVPASTICSGVLAVSPDPDSIAVPPPHRPSSGEAATPVVTTNVDAEAA